MPRARPTPEEIAAAVEAYKRHGTFKAAGLELGLPTTTVQHRVRHQALVRKETAEKAAAAPGAADTRAGRLGRIADLLERSGIPIEEIARVERVQVKEWQGLSKDADGNPVVTDMSGASVILTPTWADGPKWPVIQQAPAVTVAPVVRGAREDRGSWRTAVVLPDAQMGYWRDPTTDELVPTHDEAALGVALEIVAAADPDVVVLLGDYLDFPELGRYRQHPTFQRMTQAAINRAARFCASLRARVRPECRIAWIAGNHEERMPRYAIDNAAASFGLKRANAPDSWPVLSVPHLCRLDEYDVEFVPGYPANVYRINDHLRCIHGDKVKSGGNTAQLILKDIRHSTILGHIHRIEHAAITKDTNDGPRTYHAVSPGCLCKIDGSVPGHESGYDLDGRPIATVNNWAQGLLVVPFEPGDGRFRFEQVEIWRGHALWRGREFSASGADETP